MGCQRSDASLSCAMELAAMVQLRMAQASDPLIELDMKSPHEFIQRLPLVSERTRTHFPLKAAERTMDSYKCFKTSVMRNR